MLRQRKPRPPPTTPNRFGPCPSPDEPLRQLTNFLPSMPSTPTTARPAYVRTAATIALLLAPASIFPIARAQNVLPPRPAPQAASPNDYTPLAKPGPAANFTPSLEAASS